MGQITYERPPLAEVTFGIRFERLVGLRTAHFGAFWSRLRPDFQETHDKTIVGIPDVASMGEWFPLPRVWFVHRNQEHLLQLQSDRFFFNWRRVNDGTPYPRFTTLEPLFQEYLKKFGAFVVGESIGPLNVNGFDLVYTNHIFKGEGWTTLSDVGKLLPDFTWRQRQRPQGETKGFAWHAAFAHSGTQIEADIKFGATKDSPSRELLVLEIQASKVGTSLALDGLHKWLCAANELIVSVFEDLTDEKIQREVWKRVSK
jgi:uncharacterized protein (TIGR04255 family)